MNAPTQTPTQTQSHSTASSMMAFLQGVGIALLFGVAVVFSHYDTKSQIAEQSAVMEQTTRTYVQQQQVRLYDEVRQLVNRTFDDWHNEQVKTNALLQRILDEQPRTVSNNGNTATSSASVVNTPSTSLQAP